jgi:hypothetical protein
VQIFHLSIHPELDAHHHFVAHFDAVVVADGIQHEAVISGPLDEELLGQLEWSFGRRDLVEVLKVLQ